MTTAAVTAHSVPFTKVTITAEARAAADRVLAGGWITTGPEVVEFEREFARVVGADGAVAVSSCTAGIELSLRALRLPAGARVLTSALTFCGVAHAIRRSGAEPVLVDVDPVTMMPNAITTAAAARRAGGAAAMVVLHFAGHPAPVAELADAAGLPLSRVVEDAAHGPGISVDGITVGSISAATCFSFYATKNLPIGEGGMVTSNDPALVRFVRSNRLHGMSNDAWRRYLPGNGWRYAVDSEGLKANMTDVQAAIGRAQLVQLGPWQRRRRELAERYHQQLTGVEGIRAPLPPPTGGHAWHLYVIQVGPSYGRTRDELIAELAASGIHCSVHFIPLHHHGFWHDVHGGRHRAACELPVVETIFPTILSLPQYPALTDEDVDLICTRIAELRRPATARLHRTDRNGRT